MVHGMAHDTHCLPLAMYSQPHKHRVVCYLERQYWEGELDYSPGRPVHPDGVPSPRTTHLFFFTLSECGPTAIVTWDLEALIFRCVYYLGSLVNRTVVRPALRP